MNIQDSYKEVIFLVFFSYENNKDGHVAYRQASETLPGVYKFEVV